MSTPIVQLFSHFLIMVINDFFTLPTPSLCKGRTLYSVVRDAKVSLDVNKTRQIAQEMVKVNYSPLTLDNTSYCRRD